MKRETKQQQIDRLQQEVYRLRKELSHAHGTVAACLVLARGEGLPKMEGEYPYDTAVIQQVSDAFRALQAKEHEAVREGAAAVASMGEILETTQKKLAISQGVQKAQGQEIQRLQGSLRRRSAAVGVLKGAVAKIGPDRMGSLVPRELDVALCGIIVAEIE